MRQKSRLGIQYLSSFQRSRGKLSEIATLFLFSESHFVNSGALHNLSESNTTGKGWVERLIQPGHLHRKHVSLGGVGQASPAPARAEPTSSCMKRKARGGYFCFEVPNVTTILHFVSKGSPGKELCHVHLRRKCHRHTS